MEVETIPAPAAASDAASATILRSIATSPLWRRGGYAVVDLLSAERTAALAAEAFAQHQLATEQRVEQPLDHGATRGKPDRWLESGSGGPALAGLFLDPALLGLLESWTHARWVPAGLQGTYSYYRRAGHYLGMHRDVEVCDLALIVCLYDEGAPASGNAGSLCVYPGRCADPLEALRASPEQGAVYLRLRPGQAAILLGGMIPHRLAPLAAGHVRIVAPLCYSAVPAEPSCCGGA